MSEENKEQPKPETAPETKLPTPEEIKNSAIKEQQEKAIELQKKIIARVEELKKFEGRYFVKIGDIKKTPIKIERYAGINKSNGVDRHIFEVTTYGAKWCPAATQFLAEHDEIKVPEIEAKNEEVI